MASASLGNGGVGSSRSVVRGGSSSSSTSTSTSVDWLGREMLEMRLRDKVLDPDDGTGRVSNLLPDSFIHKS